MSGYFEIGIYHPKTEINVGTLWRSAWQLGAAGVFTIGARYHHQSGDTYRADRNLPLRHFLTWEDWETSRPLGAQLVAVELGGKPLSEVKGHPPQAIYLLGAEDHGLPPAIIQKCQMVVSIESVRQQSFNVAVAGSIIMWHRLWLKETAAR